MPEPPSSVPADPAYHHLLEQQAPEHWRPLSRAAPLAIVVSADAFALGWHAFQARRDAAPLVAAQYFVRTDRGAQDLLPQLRRFVAPGLAHVLGLDDLLADPGAGWGQYLADQGPALARLPHGLVVWLTRLG